MSYDHGWATERIMIGAAIKSTADLDEIKAAGVTVVIDGEIERDDSKFEDFKAAGITYLWNPTADDGKPKPTEWFEAVIDFCLPALVTKRASVLVHCGGGYNRGPSMGYTLLRVQGLSPMLAMMLVHDARPLSVFGGVRYAPDAEAALKVMGW